MPTRSLQRQPLCLTTLFDNAFYGLAFMSEGHPEAEAILRQHMLAYTNSRHRADATKGLIVALNSMHIRGRQIVAAFEHYGRNMEAFVEGVLQRDHALVDAVNASGIDIHEAVRFRPATSQQFVTFA